MMPFSIGKGFLAHSDPGGQVPLVVRTAGMDAANAPEASTIFCEFPLNWRCVAWKHFSLKSPVDNMTSVYLSFLFLYLSNLQRHPHHTFRIWFYGVHATAITSGLAQPVRE